MRYLAAVDTVHTAAAICDYLQDRAGAEDVVYAVTVHPQDSDDADAGDAADRDGREALNVAEVRLAIPTVETAERRGDPAPELLAAAEDLGVDELALGARAGTPGTPDGVGSTATAVLRSAQRPVVVVPLAGL